MSCLSFRLRASNFGSVTRHNLHTPQIMTTSMLVLLDFCAASNTSEHNFLLKRLEYAVGTGVIAQQWFEINMCLINIKSACKV